MSNLVKLGKIRSNQAKLGQIRSNLGEMTAIGATAVSVRAVRNDLKP